MFNTSISRFGFPCKYLHPDQSLSKKDLESIQRPYNTRQTTVAWLNRQTQDVAEQRLWDLMQHNIRAFTNLIDYVGNLEPNLRMLRLGSDCLPVYTEATWRYFWQLPDVRRYWESELAKTGELARQLDVRLSMHPGPFCVLASDNPSVVERSIEEFEYHADIIRSMGFGREFQDMKCNVHISGRKGPQGIRDQMQRLSPEARNSITIENSEQTWGLDASLELVDDVPLVIDIHHHYIMTGEYIHPRDDRFKRVLDSWRGVRPTIHYSVSREDLITENSAYELPNLQELLEQGYKKQKLRAHSDYMWNTACNAWAAEFSPYADIMVEARSKNVAARQTYEAWKTAHINTTEVLHEQ